MSRRSFGRGDAFRRAARILNCTETDLDSKKEQLDEVKQNAQFPLENDKKQLLKTLKEEIGDIQKDHYRARCHLDEIRKEELELSNKLMEQTEKIDTLIESIEEMTETLSVHAERNGITSDDDDYT